MVDDEHGYVPDDLAPLVGFLNTLDQESGVDDLSDAVSAGAWLTANVPPVAGLRWSGKDLKPARTLRDALRALALVNAGGPMDDAAVAAGTRVVAILPVGLKLVSRGSALNASGGGIGHALAEFAASYARALEQDRWASVKLCASPDCRWAYWDNSRNRSRRWCAMGVCGSRAKMRAYRRRSASQH